MRKIDYLKMFVSDICCIKMDAPWSPKVKVKKIYYLTKNKKSLNKFAPESLEDSKEHFRAHMVYDQNFKNRM